MDLRVTIDEAQYGDVGICKTDGGYRVLLYQGNTRDHCFKVNDLSRNEVKTLAKIINSHSKYSTGLCRVGGRVHRNITGDDQTLEFVAATRNGSNKQWVCTIADIDLGGCQAVSMGSDLVKTVFGAVKMVCKWKNNDNLASFTRGWNNALDGDLLEF